MIKIRERDMSAATQLANRIVAAFDAGSAEAFADCFTSDGVQHHPFFQAPNVGREAIARAEGGMFASFDNIVLKLDNIVDGGAWATFEFRVSARHSAPLPMPDGTEVPVTGKTVDLQMASVVRIDGSGLIAEEHRYQDNLAFLKQLGLV